MAKSPPRPGSNLTLPVLCALEPKSVFRFICEMGRIIVPPLGVVLRTGLE